MKPPIPLIYCTNPLNLHQYSIVLTLFWYHLGTGLAPSVVRDKKAVRIMAHSF